MLPEVVVTNDQARTTHPADVGSQELLDRVVDSVRSDSQEGAKGFLAETVVPHGGE